MDTKPTDTHLQPSIRAFFQPLQFSRKTSGNTGEILPRSSTPSSRLPKKATITKISESQIPQLRRINTLLLPVTYPDSFYHQILSPDPPISLSHVILWSDPEPKVVGGIICRLEPASYAGFSADALQNNEGYYNLYVQSLALLSPYRGKGLAAEALRSVIKAATSQHQTKIKNLYAHVWTENKEVLNWYAIQGFQREETIVHGYYRRLNPDTAWILRRKLMPSDFPPVSSVAFQSPNITTPLKFKAIQARSFQEQGPEKEWNDLPEDILNINRPADSKISRTKSQKKNDHGERAKKKRVYPAAAFGR